nr:MAG TPA: hypothetical protein [Caudoviricetes sp.]DAV62526.1 MAG TPA: hypothetical protein [Caudoviricetes sp.]
MQLFELAPYSPCIQQSQGRRYEHRQGIHSLIP